MWVDKLIKHDNDPRLYSNQGNINPDHETPGQGAISHMSQLKILHASTKTRCSQINKYFKKSWAVGA